MSLIQSETGQFRRGERVLTIIGMLWSAALLVIISSLHRDPDLLARTFFVWVMLPPAGVLTLIGYWASWRWRGRLILLCGLALSGAVGWQAWTVWEAL